MIGGALIGVIGLIGMFTSGPSEDVAANPTSTTAAEPTTTSAPVPSTTVTPETTTTEAAPTSTAPATTTTEVIDEAAVIEAFVPEFAAATEVGDVDFLYETLHPAIIAGFDEPTCRAFIEDEIVLLRNYRLTGALEGPTSQSINGIAFESWEGPVSFTFQGADFEALATFAVEDDGANWFGQCSDSQ
jgi:hypothetical protein